MVSVTTESAIIHDSSEASTTMASTCIHFSQATKKNRKHLIEKLKKKNEHITKLEQQKKLVRVENITLKHEDTKM